MTVRISEWWRHGIPAGGGSIYPGRRGKISWGKITAAALAMTILILWEALPRYALIDPIFLSTLSATITELKELIFTGEVWPHLGASFKRIAIGYSIGATLGFIASSLAAYYALFTPSLRILILASFCLPKVALLPLFILWFGIGELTKVLFISMSSFFPVVIGTDAALRSADKDIYESAAIDGASGLNFMVRIAIPASWELIAGSLKIAVGTAMPALLFGEMMVSNQGIGFLLHTSQYLLLTARLFATLILIVCLGALGYITAGLLGKLFPK